MKCSPAQRFITLHREAINLSTKRLQLLNEVIFQLCDCNFWTTHSPAKRFITLHREANHQKQFNRQMIHQCRIVNHIKLLMVFIGIWILHKLGNQIFAFVVPRRGSPARNDTYKNSMTTWCYIFFIWFHDWISTWWNSNGEIIAADGAGWWISSRLIRANVNHGEAINFWTKRL